MKGGSAPCRPMVSLLLVCRSAQGSTALQRMIDRHIDALGDYNHMSIWFADLTYRRIHGICDGTYSKYADVIFTMKLTRSSHPRCSSETLHTSRLFHNYAIVLVFLVMS